MARTVWRENKVISVLTRNGVYALAQMLRSPYIMFFNAFNEDDDWSGVNPQELETLFCSAVSGQFTSSSVITTQKLPPASFAELPRLWINTAFGCDLVKVWPGEDREQEFGYYTSRGARVVRHPFPGDPPPLLMEVVMKKIEPTDHETIDRYELDGLEMFPTLNERLYLCWLFGRKVDPAKDIQFGRPLPDEYERFVDILASEDSFLRHLPMEEYGLEPGWREEIEQIQLAKERKARERKERRRKAKKSKKKKG